MSILPPEKRSEALLIPVEIMFCPFCFVKTYKFFEALKDFKHGNISKVESLKEAFFKLLEA